MTIFGYGSLINIDSLRKTVCEPKDFRPCRLSGYRRVFSLQAKRRIGSQGPIAVLDIEEDKNSVVNGVCFEVDEEGFKQLAEREILYNFIEVHLALKDNSTKKALTVQAKDKPRTNFKYGSGIQNEYLNICLSGARKIGEDFYREFLETTYIENSRLSDIKELLAK